MKCIFLRSPLSAGSQHTAVENLGVSSCTTASPWRMRGSGVAVYCASYLTWLSKGSGISCSSSCVEPRAGLLLSHPAFLFPAFSGKNSAKLPRTARLEVSERCIRNCSWLTSPAAGHFVVSQCQLCYLLHITAVFGVLG